MGTTLEQRIKQTKFDSPQMEAALNVIVASDFLREQAEKVCAEFNITPIQFNVLRILKGVYPDGHPRCEIISRLLERGTDVTRLIDRLEKRGLVERSRDGDDRRHSHSRITEQGIKLLEKVNPKMDAIQNINLQNLTSEECLELSRLCEKLYSE
ncbi:MAG: MarR family transcriptional regulator [Ignavibacteriae bacterium]|nr:MarR family transcriptional regulator [Ignavibacteriota bacterium]